MEKAELDIFSEALGKIAEQGASKEDISMLLKAVQKGRENGEYQLFNSAFPDGKDKQANILKKMMEIHCGKDVDTTICDKFYAECGKLMPNIPLETMFKKDMLASTALAEERLKYDRTLNRDSKDEVEEPPKKVDKSTIRNIAAGVTKGEMDSITSTLAKDKNKPEITGQEQSDAQSEIES
jgi:hypothetical protein